MSYINIFVLQKVEDIREVGSYKKDTMLAGHKTVDIVVVLRSMPTGAFNLFIHDIDDVSVWNMKQKR